MQIEGSCHIFTHIYVHFLSGLRDIAANFAIPEFFALEMTKLPQGAIGKPELVAQNTAETRDRIIW